MSPEKDSRRIVVQDDATLKDIWHDVPAKYVWRLVRLIAFVAAVSFSFGVWIGQYFFIPTKTLTTERQPPNTPSNQPAQTLAGDRQIASPDISRRSPILTRPTIEELRVANQVTKIADLQNETIADRLPVGTFGYVAALRIENQMGTSDRLQFPAEVTNYSFYFEFHKTGSGLYVIGFVNPTEVSSLTDAKRIRKQFDLFSIPGEGMVPAGIEINDLSKFHTRQLPNQRGMIAEIELK
jgi:hypothetical protein